MLAENSKYVEGFGEKHYSVTECGKLYRHSYVDKMGRLLKGRWIKPFIDSGGYFYTRLKKQHIAIHRLVASAYIPNSDNKPQVNHKDGNKLNNNVDNLEWVTESENSQHAYDTGLRGIAENHCNAKLSNYDVLEIKKLYSSGKYTQKEIGVMFNTAHTNVSRIVNGKRRGKG